MNASLNKTLPSFLLTHSLISPTGIALWIIDIDSVTGINQQTIHQREREMFYLTTHSTHFIYVYMASDIWLRTILIVRKETRCRHIGYSYRLTARVHLYAPSHRQDNTYHSLCYTSRGALAGTRRLSTNSQHSSNFNACSIRHIFFNLHYPFKINH